MPEPVPQRRHHHAYYEHAAWLYLRAGNPAARAARRSLRCDYFVGRYAMLRGAGYGALAALRLARYEAEHDEWGKPYAGQTTIRLA